MNRALSGLVLTLTLALATGTSAQEVQSIDLTAAHQRTALRYPPHEDSGNGSGGGIGGASVGDCGIDTRDPHAAAVYLDNVGVAEIDPNQPFPVEFRFVNTGRLPLNIPVSPNLSDLQPADPSVPFSYLSLTLGVRLRDHAASTEQVELYGSGDHKGTTRILRPGEWIRVKADLRINPPPTGCSSVTLVPGFNIQSDRFRATPRGSWSDFENVCINENPMSPPTVLLICKQPSKSGGR